MNKNPLEKLKYPESNLNFSFCKLVADRFTSWRGKSNKSLYRLNLDNIIN